MRPAERPACNGWAYQSCWRQARWQLLYVWADRRWESYDLCNTHVEAVFAGVDAESDPPIARVWRSLTGKETERAPLASPSVPSAPVAPLSPTAEG